MVTVNAMAIISHDSFLIFGFHLNMITISCSPKVSFRAFMRNHAVTILKRAGFTDLAYAIQCATNIDGMSVADYINAYADEINPVISHKIVSDIRRVIPYVTPSNSDRQLIPVHVPEYNMKQIGNNCHFNVCILLVSMMACVVEKIMRAINDTPEIHLLRSVIGETYNERCQRPSDVIKLMELLGIDIGKSCIINYTIRDVIWLVHSCRYIDTVDGVPTEKTIDNHDVCLWLYSDRHPTVEDAVREFRPEYLIVEVQHDNINVGNDTPKTNRIEFAVAVSDTEEYSYTMMGLIITVYENGGHFRLIATTNCIEGRIYDDLLERTNVIDFNTRDEFERAGALHLYAGYYLSRRTVR